jgi:hypothetical protein
MKYIKRSVNGGVLLEVYRNKGTSNEWKLISSKFEPDNKKNWKTPPNDHQETIRDDLGLFKMLDNFDKVQEKIDNGQKEVYQDGWSIAPIDHKIPDNIPNKTKENSLGFKWISLREIPDKKEDKKENGL